MAAAKQKQGTFIETADPRIKGFCIEQSKRGYHTYRTEKMAVKFYNLHEARSFKGSEPAYDIELVGDGEVIARFQDFIDGLREQHLQTCGGEAKKGLGDIEYNIKPDLDRDKKETGLTAIKFKVPAHWKDKNGKITGSRQPLVYSAEGDLLFDPRKDSGMDADGNSTVPAFFGGSIVRLNFQVRDYVSPQGEAGVRLEPTAVQVCKQGVREYHDAGFDAAPADDWDSADSEV